jgi:4-amino-4-deoxy-L-arabinose transferase-like glycosyltransferase
MFFSKKRIIALLLFFAFLRGTLYAFIMPPWGLLDEEQHFDYILKITQTGMPPQVGRDYLDHEVLQSVLDTGRHEKFQWPIPASLNPKKWGLEGHSYEGYQGPVYYYLMVPFYLLIDRAVLDKLYGLRLLMVLFSLITVWFAIKLTRELFPEMKILPYLVAGILICLPERTASTGRLSNDLFLEIVSIAFLWVFSRSMLNGISWKNAGLLGLAAGVGLLTKFSFAGMLLLIPVAFLLNIRNKSIFFKGVQVILITTIISGPFLFYNYRLYADPTGFKGFSDVYTRYAALWDPPQRLDTLIIALWQVFRGFWVMWWKGFEAVSTPVLNIFWVALFAITLLASVGFDREIKTNFQFDRKRAWILLSFLGVILVFVVLVLTGYFGGKFPVIQGRFILPVDYPIILIITLGLSRFRRAKYIFIFLFIGLLAIDAYSLFVNGLLNFYFFSSFFSNGAPVKLVWQGWDWATRLLITNFISDKPFWVIWGTFLILPAYFLLVPGLLLEVSKDLYDKRFSRSTAQ